MIIKVDENNYDYGIDCLRCHDVNLTPEFIYVSFTNIKRGALWVPADADPPNSIFKVPILIPCFWLLAVAPFTIIYDATAGVTRLHITYPPNPHAFTDNPPVECEINFINDNVGAAGNKYYGGHASVFWIEPGSNGSIAELCDLFGIPQDGETTALVYPAPSGKQVVKLQNLSRNIKFSILRDFA